MIDTEELEANPASEYTDDTPKSDHAHYLSEQEDESKTDLEARENLIRMEERLIALQKRSCKLALSSLPHGVFVDTDVTSLFLVDSSDQADNATFGNVGVGFDLNKASPIFVQFLAWQRLMQINQQIRIERSIAAGSQENGDGNNDENSLNNRVISLIEKASTNALGIKYHKDHICKTNKHILNHEIKKGKEATIHATHLYYVFFCSHQIYFNYIHFSLFSINVYV